MHQILSTAGYTSEKYSTGTDSLGKLQIHFRATLQAESKQKPMVHAFKLCTLLNSMHIVIVIHF